MKKNGVCLQTSLILSLALILFAGSASAANGTWNSSAAGSNAFWTNSLNWSASPYPAGNQTATFSGTGNGRTTINLAGLTFGVSNIVFDTASVAAYTLGSNGINQQTLLFTNNSNLRLSSTVSTSQRVDAQTQLGHDRSASTHTFRNESSFGTLTLAGNVTAPASGGTAGGKTLNLAGCGPITISGDISLGGATSLTLNDATSGNVLLTGSNRLSTVNLNSGVLTLSGTNAISGTVSVNNNSILNVSGTNILSRLDLNGTGGTVVNVNDGYLSFDNTGGQTIYATQDAVINGPGAIVLPLGPTSNPSGDNYCAAGKTLVINARLTGPATLELWSGTGTYVLNGINDFAGNVSMGPAGTLSVAKIGNKGSTTSNLGRGTTVSLSANGTRLLYTGVGEAADRTISLGASVIIEQAGSGHLNLTAPVAVSSGSKTLTLQGSTAGTAEFSGLLGNAGGGPLALAKAGTGSWTLTTNHTFTGSTTVSGGTLALSGANGTLLTTSSYTLSGGTLLLDNTAAANNTNRLNDSAAISLAGGTLAFCNGGGAANYSENAGALTVNAGSSAVVCEQAASGQTATLRFASLTRNIGGTVDFRGAGLGADSRNRIFINSGMAEGLIGPWATVNGTNLAAYSAANGIYAAADAAVYTEIAARGPSSTIVSNDASLVRINLPGESGPIELSAPVTRIAALVQNTAITAAVNTAGATLQAAALSVPENKAPVSIGVAPNDGKLTTIIPSGELALSSEAEAGLVVNAVIANNTGASKLAKYGAGSVTLAATNTFTGTASVYGGALTLANSNALQYATLNTTGTVFDSSVEGHAFTVGSLSGTFGLPLADNAESPNAVSLTVGNGGNSVFSGTLSGEGSLVKTGSGALTLAGANTFRGGLAVSQGTLIASNANALGIAGVVNDGTLNLTTTGSDLTYSALSNSLSGSGVVNVWLATGGSTTRLNGDFSGFTGVWNIGTNASAGAAKVMMNGLDNAAATVNVMTHGTVMCSGTNTHLASVILRGGNTGEAAGQLRLDNGSTWAGPVTVAGAITDGADGHIGTPSGQSVISGDIGETGGKFTFTKAGGGTTSLIGSNTFAGPVWIRNGSVRVDVLGSVGGGASGLGSPTSAAEGTIKFGNFSTNGTVVYAGSGETSDRVIELAGTTGGAAINHAGTGLLKFTSDWISTGSGSKSITFTSASNGQIEVAGLIPQSAGGTNTVFKYGNGTLTLSHSNDFSGGVSSYGGTVVAADPQAFGPGAVIDNNSVVSFDLAHDGENATVNDWILYSGSVCTLLSNRKTEGAGINHNLGLMKMSGTTLNITNGANVTSGTPSVTIGSISLFSGGGDTTATVAPTTADAIIGSVAMLENNFANKTFKLDGTSPRSAVIGPISNGLNTVLLTKANTSTWTLYGSNTYSGATAVSGGQLVLAGTNGALLGTSAITISQNATLKLESSAETNSLNRLSDTATVTMNGGTLQYAHSGGAASYSETAGPLVVGVSSNVLATSQAAEGQTSVLTFASLSRTGSGALDFVGAGLGVDDRNKVLFSTSPGEGLIGLWATYNGTNFAAYDNTKGVTAAGEGVFTDIPAKGPYAIADDAALNARIATEGTSGPVALAGATTSSLNTLLQDSSWASTVGMTNQTLLASDIMIAEGMEALTLGTEENEGVVMPLAAGGTLNLINRSANALTVNAAVTNNTSASSVRKLGVGTVKLGGETAYTGPTQIDEGVLEFGSDYLQRLAGVISGAGTLTKSGTNLLHLMAANTYTGPTYINSGVVRPNSNTAFGGTAAGTFIADGATLNVGCTPDVGGTNKKEGLYLQTEPITVSGSGVDGAGVIVNVSTTSQMNAIGRLALAGDATFGGNNRWDIRSYPVSFNDHTFTKTGVSEIAMVAANINPGAGHIVVNQGLLRFETTTLLNGSADNTVTVNRGATLDFWQLAAASSPVWTMVLNEGSFMRVGSGSGTLNTWLGPVTLNGKAFFSSAAAWASRTFTGEISGPGSIVTTGDGTSTLYLTGTNNTYAGQTIVSNGTLYAKYPGSLSGYDAADRVRVAGGATLALPTGDGTNGWNMDQIKALYDSSTFLANTAVLSIDTTLTNLNFTPNITKTLALTKQGNNELTLSGTNTFTGPVVVNKGTLSFADRTTNGVGSLTVNAGVLSFGAGSTNTHGAATVNVGVLSYGAGSTNIGSGSLTVKGGTAGALANIGGALNLGTAANNVAIGTSPNDRSVVRSTSDITCYGVRMSEGTLPMSSAYFNDGGSLRSTRLLLACTTGNSYSYCRHNGGTASISEYYYVGFRGVGVMDVLAGTINPVGSGVIAASISAYAGSMGVLNVLGGTVNAPSNGEPLAFSRADGNLPNGQLNVAGSGVVNAAAGSGTTKVLNMNVGTTDGGQSVVNLLAGGTLIANKIGYSKLGDRRINFNGGVLKAAPGTTVGATFLQGLTAATVYPDGVMIDTTNASITINQSLNAPSDYGVSSVSVTSGGLGYIGAPAVGISGGSGSGATAYASVDTDPESATFGKVTGITVTCPGTGYQAGDQLIVTLYGGGFTNNAVAAACATLSPNVTTGGLTKEGTGVLTLGGTNTYGGTTTLNAGTLTLGNASALPTGTEVALAGGTLNLNGFTVTNTVTGNGTVTNGTLVTVLSPAGEGVVGTESLSVRAASIQGLYLADATLAGGCDRVDVLGDIDLSGIDLQIVDTDQLDRARQYLIMTCTGARTGAFKSANLPDSRWHVVYQADGNVILLYVDGTILMLK